MGGILKNRQMHYCFTRRYTAPAVFRCRILQQAAANFLLVGTNNTSRTPCTIHLPASKKHKSLINSKRTIFSFNKSASEAILEWVEKTMRVTEKRMRIAALQYANGQVNHCDELIDS